MIIIILYDFNNINTIVHLLYINKYLKLILLHDMSIDYSLTVTNQKVWSFYDTHKNISIEHMNLIMVELLENMFNGLTTDMNVNINSQILNYLHDNKIQFNSINQSLTKLNTDVCSIMNTLTMQFLNLKRDYIDDIKQIMTNNSLTINEKITSVVDKNSNHLIDRTTILLSEFIPKNNDQYAQLIQNNFRDLYHSISEDTKKLSSSISNESGFAEFIQNFDTKYTALLQNIQQPFFNSVNSTESRITTNIDSLKETTNKSVIKQEQICNEISDFLGKYNTPVHKGRVGEQNMLHALSNLYPSAEISNVTKTTSCGDFIVKRLDKPDIMVETKDYQTSVNRDEVSKFLIDIEKQKMCGVFISNNSGISFKENYQIDINGGHILVYISNCEYNRDKIKIAFDIIDNLYPKIQNIVDDNDSNHIISLEILDQINFEYKKFITNKELLTATLKDFATKMSTQIDSVEMPNLDKLLKSKYAFDQNIVLTNSVCNICGIWPYFDPITNKCKNRYSIAKHTSHCNKKNNK